MIPEATILIYTVDRFSNVASDSFAFSVKSSNSTQVEEFFSTYMFYAKIIEHNPFITIKFCLLFSPV